MTNDNPVPSNERNYFEPDEVDRIRKAASVIGSTGFVRKIDTWPLARVLEEAGILK